MMMDVETTPTVDEETCVVYTGPDITSWVAVVLLLILIVVICISNGLVFIVFLRSRRLRTITNFYIMQLAIADFGVGTSLPFNVATYFEYEIVLTNSKACAVLFAYYLLFCAASFCGLSALTYDRYLAITDPLRYHDVMTPKRYVISGLFIWVPSLVIGFLLPMMWHNDITKMECPNCNLQNISKRNYFRVVLLPAFIIISALLIMLYSRIFNIARAQIKEIQKLRFSEDTTSGSNAQRSNSKRQLKLFKAGLVVFATFYACWLPFFIVMCVQMYGGLFENIVLQFLYVLTSLMGTFNSAINPFIYTTKVPEFKREFKRLFGRCKANSVDVAVISVKEYSTML